MLRLHDARVDALTPIAPATGRTLSARVCGGGLRALLVADTLRRIASVGHDWEVVVTSEFGDDRASALNIHPAAAADPARAVDVHVGCDGGGGCTAPVVGCSVPVGSMALPDAAQPDAALPDDPLALRLALLDTEHQVDVALHRAGLDAAATTLRRWRELVWRWAQAPGAPMSREHAAAVVAALDDDLRTAAATGVLRDLETDGAVAAGAKFETFAYADRLLGLDLARDVLSGPPRDLSRARPDNSRH